MNLWNMKTMAATLVDRALEKFANGSRKEWNKFENTSTPPGDGIIENKESKIKISGVLKNHVS